MDSLNHSPTTDPNPSGRPPDVLQQALASSEAALTSLPIATDASTESLKLTSDSNMIVDSPSPTRSETERRPTVPLSYANIVMGLSPEGNKALVSWTPMGEHDLITGTFDGGTRVKDIQGLQGKALCSVAAHIGGEDDGSEPLLHNV
ncbi:unnamed protein product [Linum trigynum]|uniref:Uncharacterized protein n=1 Tax=Linum trigynum TaxID=586398 RepID=A0AAV2GSZ3_9ROSI